MAVEEEEEVDEAGPGVVDRLPHVVVDVHVLLLASPARTHPWLILGGAPPASDGGDALGTEEETVREKEKRSGGGDGGERKGSRVLVEGGLSLVVLIWGRSEQVRCVVETETGVGDVREKRGA